MRCVPPPVFASVAFRKCRIGTTALLFEIEHLAEDRDRFRRDPPSRYSLNRCPSCRHREAIHVLEAAGLAL
jgi:hypothetical protein